jgi:hypothetical protein
MGHYHLIRAIPHRRQAVIQTPSAYTELKKRHRLRQPQEGGAGMAKQAVDFHYLRANVPGSEPRKYATLEGALEAMKDLVHLQRGRGFVTTRDADGKHTSRHPDGRAAQFWAENEQGTIVS